MKYSAIWPPACCELCLPATRLEKTGWKKQQKALEVAADKNKREAEEARVRLQEQENAFKQIGLERRATLQERWAPG